MKRLEGQTAWVAGGASGMGEGISELFAEEGANVAVTDVQVDRGQELVERINAAGGSAVFYECDVTSADSVRDSINQTVEKFGGLQSVLNCAGIVHVGMLHEYSEADWDTLMGVNLKGIFLAVKYAVPHLEKNDRSYVVNIGSVGSFITQAKTPAYVASKHAVLGLTRSIAVDYANVGVRCNCICPGITDTPMLRYHMSTMPDPDAALRARLQRVPINEALTPNDIARNALYLCCEDSAGVTGTSLVVDNGYITTAEWDCAQV
jgi:NAD(P)-dependent dehydrogenase (short-subunit alcohol dehydrogenase family)